MNKTKERILNVAEAMIIKHGAEKVSLRTITQKAKVNIAAINYHFGSKDNLVANIMARILNPLLEKLDAELQSIMEAAGRAKPDLEELIRANLMALLDFSRKYPDHENIFDQLFRFSGDEDEFRRSILRLSEKVTKFNGECFIKALPELPRSRVLIRLAFFRSASLGIMKGNYMMEESRAVLGFDIDAQKMVDEMVAFLAAGFRADV